MTLILRLDCSPRGAESRSRRLADRLVTALQTRHPGSRVVYRDLAANPPSLPDAQFAKAMNLSVERREAVDLAALAEAERSIAELEACDLLVLATPMHNFTVPVVLKAWIDQVVLINRSFRSTPTGKVGRLRDRPAYIVTVGGGRYLGAAATQPDFLTPYLKTVFATIGLHDLRFIQRDATIREPAFPD
jgi:FMN-dependent NADH-azoreductase